MPLAIVGLLGSYAWASKFELANETQMFSADLGSVTFVNRYGISTWTLPSTTRAG